MYYGLSPLETDNKLTKIPAPNTVFILEVFSISSYKSSGIAYFLVNLISSATPPVISTNAVETFPPLISS